MGTEPAPSPNRACLLKRGFGLLLCKHKSPREIGFPLTRYLLLSRAQNGAAHWHSPCPKTLQPQRADSKLPFQAVYKINALIVYRILVQPPDCDPFFHNALEVEQLCALTTRPTVPCAWGVGRAAARNVIGPDSAFVHCNWKTCSTVVWKMLLNGLGSWWKVGP